MPVLSRAPCPTLATRVRLDLLLLLLCAITALAATNSTVPPGGILVPTKPVPLTSFPYPVSGGGGFGGSGDNLVDVSFASMLSPAVPPRPIEVPPPIQPSALSGLLGNGFDLMPPAEWDQLPPVPTSTGAGTDMGTDPAASYGPLIQRDDHGRVSKVWSCFRDTILQTHACQFLDAGPHEPDPPTTADQNLVCGCTIIILRVQLPDKWCTAYYQNSDVRLFFWEWLCGVGDFTVTDLRAQMLVDNAYPPPPPSTESFPVVAPKPSSTQDPLPPSQLPAPVAVKSSPYSEAKRREFSRNASLYGAAAAVVGLGAAAVVLGLATGGLGLAAAPSLVPAAVYGGAAIAGLLGFVSAGNSLMANDPIDVGYQRLSLLPNPMPTTYPPSVWASAAAVARLEQESGLPAVLLQAMSDVLDSSRAVSIYLNLHATTLNRINGAVLLNDTAWAERQYAHLSVLHAGLPAWLQRSADDILRLRTEFTFDNATTLGHAGANAFRALFNISWSNLTTSSEAVEAAAVQMLVDYCSRTGCPEQDKRYLLSNVRRVGVQGVIKSGDNILNALQRAADAVMQLRAQILAEPGLGPIPLRADIIGNLSTLYNLTDEDQLVQTVLNPPPLAMQDPFLPGSASGLDLVPEGTPAPAPPSHTVADAGGSSTPSISAAATSTPYSAADLVPLLSATFLQLLWSTWTA